jgi:GTP cyclohydrolase I
MRDALTKAGEYIIRATGESSRSGLLATPDRFANAYEFLLSGYKSNPEEELKVFDDIQTTNGMVILSGIEFVSMCEHHMLPFSGHAFIAYIPQENSSRIVGISKLARVFDCYARRLQVQERLGQQVVSLIWEALEPLGVFCFIDAQHLCITARGVRKADARMKTSHYKGCFSNAECRQEFFSMIGHKECS